MICAVYLARLDQLRPEHLGLLDPAEQGRAAGFRRDADRDRFMLGAALLRAAAGRQLGIRPASVRVDRACRDCGGQHGRPVLTGTAPASTAPASTAPAGATVHVSVSHSGDVVVVAVTSAGPVGVDVEAVTGLDYRALLPTVCTAAERPYVRVAADFYAYWTRKEAVLKATGDGLRRPMTDLAVSPPGAEPALMSLAGRPAPPCQLASVPAGPDYPAAVAVLAAAPVQIALTGAAAVLASAP